MPKPKPKPNPKPKFKPIPTFATEAAEQEFWVASAAGSGTQELTWDATSGRWAAVVMNADGSPGITASLTIGAKSGLIAPLAVVLTLLGVAIFHHRVFTVAVTGLSAILAWKFLVPGFKHGAGLEGLDGLGRVAQALGQCAGVVLGQVGVVAQLARPLQLA